MAWNNYARQNKYGNVRTTYNTVPYASKKEAAYAMELDLRVKAKDIKSWRRQPRFELYVNGHKVCQYTPDFEVTHNDGSIEVIEVKGFASRDWALRHKLFIATYLHSNPKIKYTVVK